MVSWSDVVSPDELEHDSVVVDSMAKGFAIPAAHPELWHPLPFSPSIGPGLAEREDDWSIWFLLLGHGKGSTSSWNARTRDHTTCFLKNIWWYMCTNIFVVYGPCVKKNTHPKYKHGHLESCIFPGMLSLHVFWVRRLKWKHKQITTLSDVVYDITGFQSIGWCTCLTAPEK